MYSMEADNVFRCSIFKLDVDGEGSKCAFNVVKEYPVEFQLKIFALETNNGPREYFVCTAARFSVEYFSVLKIKRFQEIIREGQPCRPYFDLEFMTSANPNVDGAAMTKSFILFICQQLEETFNIRCCLKNILQLDATIDGQKFSRHLIFHLPGQKFFENNFAVGRFVDKCVEKLRQMNEDGKLAEIGLENFFVKKEGDGDKVTSFSDTAVYDRNRNFRMFLSEKKGKRNPFVQAEDCEFEFGRNLGHSSRNNKDILMASLIEEFNYHPDNLLRFDEQVVKKKVQNCSIPSYSQRSTSKTSKEDVFEISEGICPSIDEEVLHFIRQTSPEARIKKCSALKQYSCLQYNFGASAKFCYNVDRNHKSHNIIIMVSLRRRIFYQKCFDPDCKGFKSPDIHLKKSKVIDDEIALVRKLIEDANASDTSCSQQMLDESWKEQDTENDACAKVVVDGWSAATYDDDDLVLLNFDIDSIVEQLKNTKLL